MPAAGTKKYVITAHPLSHDKEKGIWMWEPDGGFLPNGEPTGKNVLYPVGKVVMMDPEVAAPLVENGRLTPAAGG